MGCIVTRNIVCPPASREPDGTLTITWRSLGLHVVTVEQLRSCVENPLELGALRLQKNFLVNLPSDLHLLFPSLRLLDLTGNSFQKVPGTVSSMDNLETAILDHNTLDAPSALANLPQSVRVVSLAYCGLRDFPKCLGECRNITSLDLSRTNVPLNDRRVFNALIPTLKSLRVAECQLKQIPLGIQELEALTFLDLSNNTKLSFSDVDMFGLRLPKTLTSIKVCSLFKRRLPGMFALRELTRVDLSATPILDLTCFVSSANNRAPHVASETNSSNSSRASTSFNSLNSITPDRLELLTIRQSDIECLIMSRCGMSVLPAGLGHFEKLTHLDLSHNQSLRLDRKKRSLLKLVNLTHINLVGCDTLWTTDGRDYFWFQLATLPRLSVVELHEHQEAGCSRTSIPIQLLSCPLASVDGICVDKDMCSNGLRGVEVSALSSKFKPDFLFGVGAVEAFGLIVARLAALESFFIEAITASTRTKRLQISVWRYGFYLLAQSQQEEKQITPPLDVALLHVAHALIMPEDYNALCREMPADRPLIVEPLAIWYLKMLEQPYPIAWNDLRRLKEEQLQTDQSLLQFDHTSLLGDISEPKYERTIPANVVTAMRQRTAALDACMKGFFALAARLGSLRNEPTLERTLDRRFAQFLSMQAVLPQAEGATERSVPTASKEQSIVPPPDVELALALHRISPVRHVKLLRQLNIAHPAWRETEEARQESAKIWSERFGEGYHLHNMSEVGTARVRFAD